MLSQSSLHLTVVPALSMSGLWTLFFLKLFALRFWNSWAFVSLWAWCTKVKLLRDCQHIYNIWLQYSDDRTRIVGTKQPNDFKEFFFQLVVTTHPHMQSHSKHEVSLLLKWIIFLWSKMLCPFKRILMALKWIVEQRPNCDWF